MTSQRDQDNLQRIQTGDTQALAELYDRFTPWLFPVALKMLGRAADAEDAIHDTWLHVWRRAGTYDPRRGTVAAWLATVTRTRALERRRAQGPGTAPAVQRSAPSPDADSVRNAVHELDPRQLEILELSYFQGLTQGELAARLEMSAEDVRASTYMALTHLRDLLPPGEWM